MKYIVFTISLVFLSAIPGFSQTEPDTLLSPVNFIEEAGNSDALNETTSIVQYENIPDSIYIKRLAALPFEFKMTYNPIVKRYIELYTVKIKDKLQVIIGLSDFYFPIIDEVFRAYHLPSELKYISIIESALNPIAVSRARAVGLWQFMKGTGKENGLTINNYIDQRRGLTESTEAAARYLKSLYNIYNDWQLVLAAYDCGPGNVNKAIRRSGGKRDFWEIYKYLPRETRGYVPEFIGASYAFNYYKKHNINPVPASFPLQTDTLTICRNLYFAQVSQVLGISNDVLRQINPQYLKDLIPASEKSPYSLRMPSEFKLRFVELQDSIYAIHVAVPKEEVQKKEVQKRGKNHQPQTYISGNYERVTHHVRSGESIWIIAGQYKVTVLNIKEWNHLSGSTIQKGQKLIVYVPKKESESNFKLSN
jgi:membrane-bound lytic murein transglycosylase D